ncbi:hypothetical protein [Embleya sp. NPDC001921]
MAGGPLEGTHGLQDVGGTRVPSTWPATAPGDTVFVYGYNLGGSGRWDVLEADEDGSLALDWYSYDDDEDNFELAAAEQMLTVLGCTEPWDTEAYWACALGAPSRLGVEIIRHRTEHEPMYAWPMYALATAVVPAPVRQANDADGAGSSPLLTVDPAWDDTLQSALSVLQMTPAQSTPGWVRVARCP